MYTSFGIMVIWELYHIICRWWWIGIHTSMLNTVILDIVCNIYINISKGQHKKKELKCIKSKSMILMMRLNYSYMDRLYAQWGQCGIFYWYQDYPASIPAVCSFKVQTLEQLDFIVRSGKILDLQAYYNRPIKLENFKYVDFLKAYNISSTFPRFLSKQHKRM